jgi:putative GTP pyrophosphokinase
MEKDYFPVIEQFVKTRLSGVDLKQMLHEYAGPYRELMAYYRCAMMEVEAKFKVLSEELSLQSDHNPIETIKTRLKKPESILEKASSRNIALNPEDLEQGINDIAGVRVICSFEPNRRPVGDSLPSLSTTIKTASCQGGLFCLLSSCF